MPQSNSSTSSSDDLVIPARGRDLALVVAATVGALLAIDLGINLFAPMPADPRKMPNRVQQYFDYGRSVEGKLRYLVRENDEVSGPIVKSGWFDEPHAQPAKPTAPGGRLFAVYGQSMSHRVADAIAKEDPAVTVRKRGGPGAPLGHSYEMFRRDRGQHKADVVVIGVVASGLRALTSMTNMTWGFEAPSPYTYPRWILESGKLKAIQPVVQSSAQLREALGQPAKWQAFVQQLRAYDASYSPLLFEAGPSDLSATLRVAKRGFGQRHQDEIIDRYRTPAGFVDNDGVLSVARAILVQFAAEARADGAKPLVILFHDRGYGDDLYRAVSGVLVAEGVPFLSTHEIAPANEASSFVPDGHFRRKFDIVYARRALELVR
jgi:hypothetical protein